MAKTKTDNGHCVMSGANFFCNNCGTKQIIPYPIEPSMFAAMGKQFNKSHKNCKPTYKPPVVNMELPQKEREAWWLAHGHRGSSSESIFAKLSSTGLSQYKGNYPYDPSDFGRCYALIQIVPEFKTELHKMKEEGRMWEKYVNNWDKLTTMYEEQVATEKANGMWEFMQTLWDKKNLQYEE